MVQEKSGLASRKGRSEPITSAVCSVPGPAHGLASGNPEHGCEQGLRHLSAWRLALVRLEPGERL